MLLQAKERQRWPANRQKLGKMPGIDSSSHPSEGINFVDTFTLDSSLQNCGTINFGCVSHQVCGSSYGSPGTNTLW